MGKKLSKDAVDGGAGSGSYCSSVVDHDTALPEESSKTASVLWRSRSARNGGAGAARQQQQQQPAQAKQDYYVAQLLEYSELTTARLELTQAANADDEASAVNGSADGGGGGGSSVLNGGHASVQRTVRPTKKKTLKAADAAVQAASSGSDRTRAVPPAVAAISPLQCDITYETANRLRIKIFDPARQRFEVRYEDVEAAAAAAAAAADATTTAGEQSPLGRRAAAQQYDVDVTERPFAVTVTRKSTGVAVFDMRGSQMCFENDRIRLKTALPSNYVYGLGERRKRFLIDCTVEHTLPFWCFAADSAEATDYANSHSVHPFLLGLEDDGLAYGLFFLNSCPMEVHITPGCPPQLSYTVGGGIVDLHVFLGPTPLEVAQQYQEVIGRPAMPPYWALGYHLSRWGYTSSAKLQQVVLRNRAIAIPYESQWTDIDMMDSRRYFSYKDIMLPGVVEDLHSNGQKYVVVCDPFVCINQDDAAYVDGVDRDLFVNKFDGSWPLVGKAWCGDVLFIDYTHPAALDFCMMQARRLHSVAPFDGMFLDRNEPANLLPGCREDCSQASPPHPLDVPTFLPGKLCGQSLFSRTVCPSSRQHRGNHYNVHNLYGHFQLKVMHSILRELTGKRPFVVSRSTFAGSGKYGGHWSGDNKSSFVDLRYSISEMLDFNMFGVPLVGASVGGSSRECTEELMVRWTQVAAFYPLMRNHNTHPDLCPKDQDPAAFREPVQDLLRDAVLLRYSLLPHLYTLFYENHVKGAPVVRPLFMQYPRDRRTFSIDEQFMWGESLLISPCLHQAQVRVDAYFPHDVWYNYFNGTRLTRMGTMLTLHTPLDSINVHIRGGCIVPMQSPALSTPLSRQNSFGLVVALSSKHAAAGRLYWDDGESLDPIVEGNYNLISFEAKEGRLVSTIEHGGHYTRMILGGVRVMGIYVAPQTVMANGKAADFDYNESSKVLLVSGLQLSLLTPLSIEWQ